MKTLLLILVAFYGYSQTISINVSNLMPIKQDQKITAYSGYSFDASLKILNTKISPTIGVNYTSYKFASNSTITDDYGNKIGSINEYYSIGYLGIPVGVKYEITKTSIVPFLSLGVNNLIKVSNNKNANSFVLVPYLNSGLKYNITDNLSSQIQLGYSMPIGEIYQGSTYNSINISLGIGYKL